MSDANPDYSIEIKIFDDVDFLFVITPDGDQLIPVKVFADYFGIELKKANQIITRNKALFRDKVVKLETETITTSGHISMGDKYRLKTVDCFTIAGSLQWINLLSHDRYFDDRRELIIKMKNWLVDLGASVIQGKPLGQVERGEVRIISAELTNRIKNLLEEKIISKYTDGRRHDYIYSNECRMLNLATLGEHQRGMKETLNAAGLQVHNTGQIADIALLNADVLEYKKRKSAIALTTEMVHGAIDKAKLKLNGEERARIGKNCSKTQKGLDEFSGAA